MGVDKLLVLVLATLVAQGSVFSKNTSPAKTDMLSSIKDRLSGGLLGMFGDSSLDSAEDSHSPLGGMHDIFNIFKIKAASTVWWKGPSVCVDREEIDESQHNNDTDVEDHIFGNFHFSSCQQSDTKYVCRTKVRNDGVHKTYVVKYQCCQGFKRAEDKPGCVEALSPPGLPVNETEELSANLKSLEDTLTAVGAKDYLRLVKTTRLEEKLTANNLTIFAPSDEAIRDFTDSVEEVNQVEFYAPPPAERRRRAASMDNSNMRDIVLGHMTQGIHDISEIVDEQILKSDNDNSPIRINIYPTLGERVVTANCARITSANNYANNGIVHVVDRVIQPVNKTVLELLSQDAQFTMLKTMLVQADMLELLRGLKHMTLFAPTDSAFDKLQPGVLERLMQAKTCISNVVRHHILPHVVCSSVVQTRAFTRNLGESTVILERHPEDGKLFIDNVQIVAKDIVATDGVIHVVDEVLMPDSGRPVSGVLSSHNLTTFLSLLKEAGLTESLDGMNNVTLFAPTDEALAKPEAMAVIEKVRADKDRLRDLLLYHSTGPEVHSCDLTNNQELKTGLADKSLRINVYATLPFFSGGVDRVTVQCARVVNYNNRACSGVVHQVERLLVPPAHTIMETLDSMANYSIFSGLIKNHSLEAELRENAPFTLLAPSDEVFKKLDAADFKRLQTDKEAAVRVLKQHILPEMLCCSGVGVSSWPFVHRVETLGGHLVNVQRDSEDHIHIGSTTVQQCDIMATNGIIHTVNKIMLPQAQNRLRIASPKVEVFLYGL